MAITITPGGERLAVAPAHGRLPFEITLSQPLGSTRAPENAAVTHVLDQEHNVYFKAGNGPRSKSFQPPPRQVTQASGQAFDDQVTLVEGPGTPRLEVNISETITGESGLPLHASCLVNIRAAGGATHG